MAEKLIYQLYFPSEKLRTKEVIDTFFEYEFLTATHMKGIGRGYNTIKYKEKAFLEGLEKNCQQ